MQAALPNLIAMLLLTRPEQAEDSWQQQHPQQQQAPQQTALLQPCLLQLSVGSSMLSLAQSMPT
jgi:hypothetical protein